MEKLSWVTFLNAASTWETKTQAEEYFSCIAGVELKLTPAQAAALSKLEEYIRVQLSSLHFGHELELNFLNSRLAKIPLHLKQDKSAETGHFMPSLSAAGKTSHQQVQQILDTIVLQFAIFLGDTIDGANSAKVHRCEALYRAQSVEECKAYYTKFRSLESSWKDELVQASQSQGEIERCADFFVASPGTKFCSDTCRFNSFSLRKQTQTPGYQAEKQRRYRERQKARE